MKHEIETAAPTQSYLATVAKMLTGARVNPAQWMLDNGRSFGDWAPLPARVRRGFAKRCYWNAAELAQRGQGRYVYCEGYATGVIPVEHAWCFDRQTGLVADPTWKEGSDYFGVPVQIRYALRCLENERPVVADWMHDFPVVTGVVDIAEWQEVIA